MFCSKNKHETEFGLCLVVQIIELVYSLKPPAVVSSTTLTKQFPIQERQNLPIN